MKTYFVPVEGKEYPLIQTADWRFFVPLRPIYARLGVKWNNSWHQLFGRANILALEDHPVEQRDGTFIGMTCVPLMRFGWWFHSLEGPRKGAAGADRRAGIAVIAEQFMRAFEIVLSGIMGGNDPNSPAVPLGKDLLIAELQTKLAEMTTVHIKNRKPRKAINADDVAQWRALHRAGNNFQDIAALAGRSPATVRRSILGEG
jgi:hypothetical protein